MSSYYHQERRSFTFTPRNRITYAVQRLILANVIVFAVQLIVNIPLGVGGAPGGPLVVGILGFRPDLFTHGWVWQPFTYMFMHASLSHLFFNMLGLYFFGPDVERVLSTRQFFRFYILCGAVGVLASLIPWWLNGANAPVVGASGATLGVLVAFAFAYPDREIFLFPLPFPINARAIVLLIIILDLVGALGQSNVAVTTHLGGMAIAFLYMKLAPRIRDWSDSLRNRRSRPKKNSIDAVGEAVDNIFKFEDEKRRRK